MMYVAVSAVTDKYTDTHTQTEYLINPAAHARRELINLIELTNRYNYVYVDTYTLTLQDSAVPVILRGFSGAFAY